MGEWTDHFEDFPDEDPANYDEYGRYDPGRKQRLALAELQKRESEAFRKRHNEYREMISRADNLPHTGVLHE